MDPFLEHPAYFPSVHANLITYLREFLQPRLPEPYYAETADRVWVEASQRRVEPDVNLLRAEVPTPPRGQGGGVAVAEATVTDPVVVNVPHEERRETFLEIYARREQERLVTTVEVLSVSNKTPGERGREAYLRKQREVLDSQVHLVEIDLLRGGQHTTAVPLGRALEKAGPFHYHVCVHHFDNLEDYFVYPLTLARRLPTIAIPLLPGDGAVAADLQAVFDRCYDTGPYRRRVRYPGMEIVPPLGPDWAEWVAGVLREKGLLAGTPAG
jgi:hypothetical protein